MARAASASMQSVLDRHARRARKQWEKVLSNSLRRRRRAVRQEPTRLPRPLFSWRRIVRVSFMGQNWPSTAAAPPFETHGGVPMSNIEHYGILVIGSGEAGKHLTWNMAQSGHRSALVVRQKQGGRE